VRATPQHAARRCCFLAQRRQVLEPEQAALGAMGDFDRDAACDKRVEQ
jgi:hypothetical protein